MDNLTLRDRSLAIAASCAFTVGSLLILLGDVLMRPAEWTTYHVLTILTVIGTIAAGHLMKDAGRAGHYLAAVGFLVLFFAGTGLVVSQSIGRQAETTDAKVLDTEARNSTIADKGADLARARQRLADADKMVELETKTGGCKSNCKDWKQRATEVRSHIAAIEGQIATLGAPAPVTPKATKMADVAALFGFQHDKAKAAFMLLEPFLWTLFFEIGSIVSLGFAFRHRPVVSVPAVATVPTVSALDYTDVPKISDYELEELRRVLRRANGPLSNNAISKAMGVQKAEGSRRVTKAVELGLVSRRKTGKEVAITLN